MTNELTTVPFYGATLLAVRGTTPAGTMVIMKPVSEGMGLSWQGQHEKLKGHPVLSKGIKEILIPSAGGVQAMTALPLSRLNFWLATIQPNKVANLEARAKVIRYQEECAEVLFAHFFEKAVGRSSGPSVADAEAIIAACMAHLDDAVAGAIRRAFPALRPTPSAPPPGYLRFPDYLAAKGIACLSGRQKSGLSKRLARFCKRHGFKVEEGFGAVYRGGNAYPIYAVDRWWQEGGATLTMSLVKAEQAARCTVAAPLFGFGKGA